MKEYGGYIELDKYTLPMLHENAISLNCGRNCLAYLIKEKKIKKILLPYFLCDSVKNTCFKENVEVQYYHIDVDFLPIDVKNQHDEWVYIVNYYGQVGIEKLVKLKEKFKNIIVDNAQDYFQTPIKDIDTIYTCRKFLGVADGAFLYTDVQICDNLPVDESYDRMHFLLGRFERTASEFYKEYVNNNRIFANEPIKQMSKLTKNLLHAIDYNNVKKIRTENFMLYFNAFETINTLKLKKIGGAFAYPLLIRNGDNLRKILQKLNIYIPTLWPNVLDDVDMDSLEYNMANNILPLPCDQRYNSVHINFIISKIMQYIN